MLAKVCSSEDWVEDEEVEDQTIECVEELKEGVGVNANGNKKVYHSQKQKNR